MSKEWLSIGRAATLSGLERQTLRELLRSGRLPGIRQRGRWRVARADLAALGERRPSDAERTASNGAASPLSVEQVHPGLLLREREAEIRRLQDERLHMARLVGFLQAQLIERDARIALLEARALPETVHAVHDHQDEPRASSVLTDAPPAPPSAEVQDAAPPPLTDRAVDDGLPSGDAGTLAVPAATGRPRVFFAVLRLFGRRRI